MTHNNDYGARIERGTIESVDGSNCVIAVYDRYGLKAECALPDGCAVGDRVLFAMFDDGECRIILKM